MKKVLSCVFAMLFFSCVYAQSSEVITEILESKTVTFGQVCYFTAVQQDLVSEDSDYSQAIQVLYEKGQLPRIVYMDSPIPLVDIAYLFAHAWNVKGGIMYNLFNGAPRYAFKQLKADGIIPKNKDPSSYVSGAQVLEMFTNASLAYGQMKLYVDTP